MAESLFISERTMETHRKNILTKTCCKSVVGLIQYAIKHKLLAGGSCTMGGDAGRCSLQMKRPTSSFPPFFCVVHPCVPFFVRSRPCFDCCRCSCCCLFLPPPKRLLCPMSGPTTD
ncbi:response regulator transcription factor [Hymenobacter terricola]|uniref:response regulator transcription factor n=1 Tax=Hymenobacter terricola TaxID=2819236 RepID=UPI00293D61E6|nr:LuxR C-terminal-related transcriptional regulator [Hymenobacter terricola]